ncbi:MAG: acetyl-CoA carboxylase biotin carboxyl carrier protein subunit [Candidatus Kapaibacteriales bacterium]
MGTDSIVKIGEFDFQVISNQNGTILVGENELKFEIVNKIAPSCYIVKINDRNEFISFIPNNENKYRIYFRGYVYDLEIIYPLHRLLEQIAKDDSSEGTSVAKITAPMPGLVVKILAQEGMQVKKGEKVIIIEAMKMENALHSPISGYIKKVFVQEGKPVEKGALLVEISYR